MFKDIIIRPCRLEECGEILELWRDAGSTPSISDSIDNIERALKTSNGLLLVAEYQSRIIGTVMGGWDGWRGNIYRLAVLPRFRRQGIGRTLVQELEKQLVSKGVSKISVLVEKGEELAIAFWESMKNEDYRADERLIRYAKSF
jgi:ribosomal protein S18 acetylase RimI-like enzyme